MAPLRKKTTKPNGTKASKAFKPSGSGARNKKMKINGRSNAFAKKGSRSANNSAPCKLTAVRVAKIVCELGHEQGSTFESIKGKLQRTGYNLDTASIRGALARALQGGLLRENKKRKRFCLPHTHQTRLSTTLRNAATAANAKRTNKRQSGVNRDGGRRGRETASSSRATTSAKKPARKRRSKGRGLAQDAQDAQDTTAHEEPADETNEPEPVDLGRDEEEVFDADDLDNAVNHDLPDGDSIDADEVVYEDHEVEYEEDFDEYNEDDDEDYEVDGDYEEESDGDFGDENQEHAAAGDN